ncbi:MAG: DNA repair protein RecN [Treponema sp.]|jgi:DNA repair protein RecN (Recombination protein N)|nr:DNA repair protein RecN [Treponema sp.]
MLEDLTIKNFALIDSAAVEFKNGFTVLSGETGAGKSILIGALSFLLGGKAGVDQIRTGSDAAEVSGTFYLGPEPAEPGRTDDDEPGTSSAWLDLHGIETDGGRVLLRRILKSNGKSSAWIQSTPVTRADLSAFSSFLVDIHGQHEHQSLLHVPEHRKYLDSYAGIDDAVAGFSTLYKQLAALRQRLAKLSVSDDERRQKREMLDFAVKEIDGASLKAGEDEELEAEETKLSSFEKLYESVRSINGTLSDSDESVMPVLKRLRNETTKITDLDGALAGLASRFENVFFELSDITEEFKNYEQTLVFDPARLEAVQDRLAQLFKLKKKYASSAAGTVAEVLAYGEKARTELASLENDSEERSKLESSSRELEKTIYTRAKVLSAARKSAALKMSGAVGKILGSLGMKGTVFSVKVAEKPGTQVEQKCDQYGMDDIEFLISANPGSPLLPLAKIASGGELSRVMLAIKTVLADTDAMQTMVFDEIDTGVGGEVAVAVGSHLKNLAVNRQILCITHLASIAVYADNQIKIEKKSVENGTRTAVLPVTGDARISEIARMLSGDPSSEESLKHAQVMLEKYAAAGGR